VGWAREKRRRRRRRRSRRRRRVSPMHICLAATLVVTCALHLLFLLGLLTAMRLRKRIQQLQHYRRNGIRTLAEAELYESDRKKRDTEQALKKQRQGASYLYESGRSQTGSGSRERKSRALNRERSTTDIGGGDEGEGMDLVDAMGAANGESSNGVEGGAGGSRERALSKGEILEAVSAAGGTYTPLPSIKSAPGAELLSQNEQELCAVLRLLPRQYLVIKDALIRESFRLGYLEKHLATQLIRIDVNKTSQIYDFFLRHGWVTAEPAPVTGLAGVAAVAAAVATKD
jgi:transcriptional adapter 2-alpha